MIALMAAAVLAFSPSAALAAPETPTPTVSPSPTPVEQNSDGGGPGWGVAAIALVVGLGAGAGGSAYALGGRRRRSVPVPAPYPTRPATVPTPPGASAAQVEQLDRERAGLLLSVIEARDVVPSAVLRERLDQAIGAAGVVLVAPRPGERFDPTQHRAVRAYPATTAEQQGTVAETIQPGFLDRRGLIRPADVEVFQWNPR